MTIRAFVAVRVPTSPPLGDLLNEFANMGRAVKPVAADNLHVTLKFLGETDAGWIDRTCDLLDDVASQLPAFDVTLQGLGAFPKPSRPSIIWTGITPPEPMIELATTVEDSLTSFGFASESRPFLSYVTLARIKARPPQELSVLLERHADTVFAAFRVSEIVLMQSELSPNGPTYRPLLTAYLA